MHRLFRQIPLLLGMLLLAGCALTSGRSPEAHYYVMALPQDVARTPSSRDITGLRVGVGPISLPGYLDQRRIFIRQANATDVTLAEYDLWGESLQDGVSRLLVEDLSARLASAGGMALPLRAGNACDWRVSVDVTRFDGAPGNDVTLDAGWSLATGDGEVVREGHFLSTAQAAPGIDGLVRAHGELLSRLGGELAAALREMPQNREQR